MTHTNEAISIGELDTPRCTSYYCTHSSIHPSTHPTNLIHQSHCITSHHITLDSRRTHRQRKSRLPPSTHVPFRHRPPRLIHMVQRRRKILPHPLPKPAPTPILRKLLGSRCNLSPGRPYQNRKDQERVCGRRYQSIHSVHFELWR